MSCSRWRTSPRSMHSRSWVYTSPDGGDAAARDAAWLDLRSRFEPGVDWTGLEAERVARWYRQLHIFLYPFYYIEYAIAQIGALQVWRNARRDPERAVAAYRRFLALGATRSLPDLYREAGIEFSFDAGAAGGAWWRWWRRKWRNFGGPWSGPPSLAPLRPSARVGQIAARCCPASRG